YADHRDLGARLLPELLEEGDEALARRGRNDARPVGDEALGRRDARLGRDRRQRKRKEEAERESAHAARGGSRAGVETGASEARSARERASTGRAPGSVGRAERESATHRA